MYKLIDKLKPEAIEILNNLGIEYLQLKKSMEEKMQTRDIPHYMRYIDLSMLKVGSGPIELYDIFYDESEFEEILHQRARDLMDSIKPLADGEVGLSLDEFLVEYSDIITEEQKQHANDIITKINCED